MKFSLPPAPRDDNVEARTDWFNRVREALSRLGASLTWAVLDKTGSKLTDIETRNHSDLQNIQGGTYHLSSVEYTDLTDGGTTTLHTHSLGYGIGNGGTVTQLTSKSTGVTLNTICGQITTNNASLAAGDAVVFRVTNSLIADTDVILVNIASGSSPGAYDYDIDKVGSGYFDIHLYNYKGGSSLSESVVFNFVVIKSVAS